MTVAVWLAVVSLTGVVVRVQGPERCQLFLKQTIRKLQHTCGPFDTLPHFDRLSLLDLLAAGFFELTGVETPRAAQSICLS